jgi:pectinesterase
MVLAAHAPAQPATAPATQRARLTIVLAGDSTVTDKVGWGAPFARCFPEGAEVVNVAQAGRSSKSFIDEGHWQKCLDARPAIVLIQFGHNDQPGKGPERETDPATTYRAHLSRFVDEARAAGATPVLLTPLSRRTWGDDARIRSTLEPYAAAVRDVAAGKKTALIDLHARSIDAYESMGAAAAETISPRDDKGVDHTHLNEIGATYFGALVADELRRVVPLTAGLFRLIAEPPRQPTQTQPAARPAAPAAPQTARGPATLVVAADGSGEFTAVQAAVDAVAPGNADRTTIRIKPGRYVGPVLVPREKTNVSFVGDSAETTILTYALNVRAPQNPASPAGVRGTGVVIRGDGFEAENLTFENTSGDHGQAMALRTEGDRGVYRRCRLIGWQDTLLAHSRRQYFVDCTIEGRVDFIYGAATAVFDRCDIRSKNGGYVTAASTLENEPFGFVFLDCRLTSADSAPAYLGRPWRPFAGVAFVRCDMGAHVRPEGWHNWGKPDNERTARYGEFGSTGPGGSTQARVAWAKPLSPEQAAVLTPGFILRGADGWDPTRRR